MWKFDISNSKSSEIDVFKKHIMVAVLQNDYVEIQGHIWP